MVVSSLSLTQKPEKTMPYVSANLRLLFCPLKPTLSFPRFICKPHPKPFSFFTLLSSSSKRQRNVPYRDSFNLGRRNSSTFRERKGRGKEVAMEETAEESGGGSSASTFGFNKRRAEGRDKSDRPKKNPQLKERKLNPTNTIAYVQVIE